MPWQHKRMQRMNRKSSHRRAWSVARGMIVLTTTLALVAALLVGILTHGPAAHAVAASMDVEMAEEIAAHGHAHDEASHDHQGGSFGDHNPADHDHQLHALVCQTANIPKPLPDKAQSALSNIFRHLTPEGPRRPPRSL